MKGTKSRFSRIDYSALNSKQREVHNFHHIAAVLARHGYATYPIRDDWNGGDMIARHMLDPSEEMLTIQIKGRLTFDRKYQNKKLWVAFPHEAANPRSDVYIYPHDEILERYEELRAAKGQQSLHLTGAWQKDGLYSWGSPPKDLLEILEPYRVSPLARQSSRADDEKIPGQTRLMRLAAYVHALQGPMIHWVEDTPLRGSGADGDPYVLGSGGASLTKAALEFVQMLHDAGWVLQDFDWAKWCDTAEGRALQSDITAVVVATEQQLAMLITALVRTDRLAEGVVAQAFQTGLMAATAVRAASLQR